MIFNNEEIKKIFIDNKGIVETSDITAKGFTIRHLNKLIDDGFVYRIKRGLYQWIDEDIDDLEILYKIIPEAVLCMGSALHYYLYTDRTPDSFYIAVDRDINKKKLAIDYPRIKPYYVESHYLKIGVVDGHINGVKVKVYDRERTICDVIRYINKMDKEIFNKAVKSYIKDNKKNIPKLIEYAKIFRVYKKMQTLIGVWL